MDPYLHTAIATGLLYATYRISERVTQIRMVHTVADEITEEFERLRDVAEQRYDEGVHQGMKSALTLLEQQGISDMQTLADALVEGARQDCLSAVDEVDAHLKNIQNQVERDLND